MSKVRQVLWAGLLWVVACEEGGPPLSEVVRPRIMAIVVQAEDEPERANLREGEQARVRLQLGYAQKPPTADAEGRRAGVGAVFCMALRLTNGNLTCLWEVPIPDLEQLDVGPDEVALRFVVPSREELLEASGLSEDQALAEGNLADLETLIRGGDFPDLVMFGAVCDQGMVVRRQRVEPSPTELPRLFRCRRPEDIEPLWQAPLTFTRTVPLELVRGDNDNPSMGCQAEKAMCRGVDRSGEPRVAGDVVLVSPLSEDAAEDAEPDVLPWPPPPADIATSKLTGCADEDLPIVHVGEDDYRIRLRFDPNDREPLPEEQVVNPDQDVEELFVFAALTEFGGTLDAYQKVLDYETPDDELEIEFDYTPPEDAGEVEVPLPRGGRIVRFYFAVRDTRLGYDFSDRALCLRP